MLHVFNAPPVGPSLNPEGSIFKSSEYFQIRKIKLTTETNIYSGHMNNSLYIVAYMLCFTVQVLQAGAGSPLMASLN